MTDWTGPRAPRPAGPPIGEAWYEDEWRTTPPRERWKLAVPAYADDPATGHGWPTATGILVRGEVRAAMSPTAGHLLDRLWGCLIDGAWSDPDPTWPALAPGATTGQWSWVDPLSGPVEFTRLWIDALDEAIARADLTDVDELADRELDTRLRGVLDRILTGTEPGWDARALGLFFPPETRAPGTPALADLPTLTL